MDFNKFDAFQDTRWHEPNTTSKPYCISNLIENCSLNRKKPVGKQPLFFSCYQRRVIKGKSMVSSNLLMKQNLTYQMLPN